MPGFERTFGSIGTQIEVIELESAGGGGNEVETIEIPQDTVALLVVTEGEGEARLRLNGEQVVEANNNREFAWSFGNRLVAYVGENPQPGEGELAVSCQEGKSFRARIIRLRGKSKGWLINKLKGMGECWVCKKMVRSLITFALALLGIPDLTFGDEFLPDLAEAVARVLGDLRPPQAILRLLEKLFGEFWPDVLRDLAADLLDNLPFNLASRALCEKLGFCP